jgi:hypothetical protein
LERLQGTGGMCISQFDVLCRSHFIQMKKTIQIFNVLLLKFYKADSTMAGNYQHSFFDYSTLEPKDSWICKQEDVAAVMLILYSAYQNLDLNISKGLNLL